MNNTSQSMIYAYNKPVTRIPLIPTQDKNEITPYILLMTCFLLLFVTFELLQSSLMQVVKSVAAGVFLVYCSWELMYFDSLTPGIQHPSPLSPSVIRTVSGHTLHLNHAIAVILGIFFTLFVNWST